MKTLVVTPHNQDDIDKLMKLLTESELVDDVRIEEEKPFRKLTSKDIALGIGRPATNEELMEYFERNKEREFIDIDDAFEAVLSEPIKKKTPKSKKGV